MPKISASGQLFSVVDPFTGEANGVEYRASNAGRAARRAYFCLARERPASPSTPKSTPKSTTTHVRDRPELTEDERRSIDVRLGELRADNKVTETEVASYQDALDRARFSTHSLLLGIRKHGTVPIRSYLCFSAPILRPTAIEVQKLCVRKSVARFVSASALLKLGKQ